MSDCHEDDCAEGTLECGGLTPPSPRLLPLSPAGGRLRPLAPLVFMPGLFQGGVKPPHSKALRAFSQTVVNAGSWGSTLRMT